MTSPSVHGRPSRLSRVRRGRPYLPCPIRQSCDRWRRISRPVGLGGRERRSAEGIAARLIGFRRRCSCGTSPTSTRCAHKVGEIDFHLLSAVDGVRSWLRSAIRNFLFWIWIWTAHRLFRLLWRTRFGGAVPHPARVSYHRDPRRRDCLSPLRKPRGYGGACCRGHDHICESARGWPMQPQ